MKKTNLFVATALATAAMAFTAWGGAVDAKCHRLVV